MHIERIISGGQTGADRAALDAALAKGCPHGGWCPRGRLAEDGPIPRRYRLRQMRSPDYASRTERNVLAADATIIFTFGPPRFGSGATIGYARRNQRPWLHLDLNRHQQDTAAAEKIIDWLRQPPLQKELWPAPSNDHKKTAAADTASNNNASDAPEETKLVLNIAGSRASSSPDIYDRVFNIVTLLLELTNKV